MVKKNVKDKKLAAEQQESKDLAKTEYTKDQQKRLVAYHDRAKRKALKFKIKNVDSKDPAVEPIFNDADLALVKLSEALGTTDKDLQDYLLNQVIQVYRGFASRDGYNYEHMATFSNITMAILNGVQPQDEIEGMLVVQMIGVHNIAMETLKRAILVGQTDEGKELNVNQAAKMMRVLVAQMEALKRYRTGGQQKMVVEHVHVNADGQAIVGTVNQGGGKKQ